MQDHHRMGTNKDPHLEHPGDRLALPQCPGLEVHQPLAVHRGNVAVTGVLAVDLGHLDGVCLFVCFRGANGVNS